VLGLGVLRPTKSHLGEHRDASIGPVEAKKHQRLNIIIRKYYHALVVVIFFVPIVLEVSYVIKYLSQEYEYGKGMDRQLITNHYVVHIHSQNS